MNNSIASAATTLSIVALPIPAKMLYSGGSIENL